MGIHFKAIVIDFKREGFRAATELMKMDQETAQLRALNKFGKLIPSIDMVVRRAQSNTSAA